MGVFWGRGGSAYRRIGVLERHIGVSAYSGPGGSGRDQRIGVSVFWVWGRWGGLAYWRSTLLKACERRIGVSAYSGVGGGRGVGISAYRRIIVFGAASGASAYCGPGGWWGRGSAYLRIGVLSFLGQRAAHRRIGVFWAWRSGGFGGGIGVSAYGRILGLGGSGGGVDRRIGVSACWSGTSAYRRILGLEGGQGRDRRIGVSAYSGPEGSVVGGGAIGVTAYRRMLVCCPSLHARCVVAKMDDFKDFFKDEVPQASDLRKLQALLDTEL